ncbi:ATP-binding protein [uncultured Propionivibrio sp.]|uniref:sensor histidine kinase n=1 Tax=uncultured Propionivibrio sp. TaxID=426737 RepID=UPI0029C025E2|nr:ATP-binding protein [uncultured Propionivibrio sp.]
MTAVRVMGDPELLHRVFDNLLRNAMTHAADGKWVRLSLSVRGDIACVQVEDRGPGVLSSETEQIFQPFYRGARTSGVSGHGLGLVIARQIVENYGGQIKAENRPEGGLRVSVYLPMTAL